MKEYVKENLNKIYLFILITIILVSFFMVGLNFNFIGHNYYSTNLILGFTLGLISIIASSILVIMIKKNKLGKWVNFSILLLIIVLFTLCLVFGSMGYINAKAAGIEY